MVTRSPCDALILGVFTVCVNCVVSVTPSNFPRILHVGTFPHLHPACKEIRALVHAVAYIVVGEIILNVRKPPFRTGKQTGNLWQQITEM